LPSLDEEHDYTHRKRGLSNARLINPSSPFRKWISAKLQGSTSYSILSFRGLSHPPGRTTHFFLELITSSVAAGYVHAIISSANDLQALRKTLTSDTSILFLNKSAARLLYAPNVAAITESGYARTTALNASFDHQQLFGMRSSMHFKRASSIPLRNGPSGGSYFNLFSRLPTKQSHTGWW